MIITKIKLLIILFTLIILNSCETTEPIFDPDKVFVKVENGTLDAEGEFEIFNYFGQSVFIHHFQFPYCSFFTYSVEKQTDSGFVNLDFDEVEGKWKYSDSTGYPILLCELYMPPAEIKSWSSFKQKITGINQPGNYRLTINYSLKEDDFRFYTLLADYKVTH